MSDSKSTEDSDQLDNPSFREKLAEEVFMIYGGAWGNALGTADRLLLLFDQELKAAKIEENKLILNRIVTQDKKGYGTSWYRGYVSAQHTLRAKIKKRIRLLTKGDATGE